MFQESIALEEKKVQEVVPKNPPGTPKMEDQEPFWPPHGTAPQMQPIPPRHRTETSNSKNSNS